MTEEEFARVLETFAAWRGSQPIDPSTTEARELRGMLAGGTLEQAVRAIRSAAASSGFVTVARVYQAALALRAEAVAADMKRRSMEAAKGSQPEGRPGFPVAEGQPTGAFLRWVAVGAIMGGRSAVRNTIAKFVSAELVLDEHVERILAAIDPELRGEARAAQASRAIAEIEREIGDPWVRVEARQFVRAAKIDKGAA